MTAADGGPDGDAGVENGEAVAAVVSDGAAGLDVHCHGPENAEDLRRTLALGSLRRATHGQSDGDQ